MSIREVLAALGNRAKPRGQDRWMAECPSHSDGTPSLSVSVEHGTVLLKCFGGCETDAVVAALGLEMSDLFAEKEPVVESLPPAKWPVTAEYFYRDTDGTCLYRVQRKTSPDSGKKTFVQHGASETGWRVGPGAMDGVRRVPYRLEELVKSAGLTLVVEGEKDCDNLVKLGLTATTNAGGAGKWDKSWAPFFRGRQVVILPDNDEPGKKHAEDVRASLEGEAASVTILELPGLMKKGDVSDWLAAGGTKERLLALVAGASFSGFQDAAIRLAGEREERLAEGKRMLEYGMSYLDDATGGIAPHDLVLLGARTGVGKTALATICSLHNAAKGKRVFFFALEAERREIERRMKWASLLGIYYRNTHAYERRPVRYLDWRNGRLDALLSRYEKEADDEVLRMTRNLKTFYRENTFFPDDFGKHMSRIREEADLAVLDHYHVLDSEEKEQNKAQERAAKQIRDTGLMAGVPVLLVAHTRKTDKRTDGLVPDLDDFMGSSHLTKVVTQAVMIAPAFDVQSSDKTLWPTYVHIPKLRGDSSVNRYIGIAYYDARQNMYHSKYQVGRLGGRGAEFIELCEDDMPDWARK